MYKVALIGGLVSVLTTGVFSFLVISIFMLQKLQTSPKENKVNALLFGGLVILIFSYSVADFMKKGDLVEISENPIIHIAFASYVIFIIWLLSSFVKPLKFLTEGVLQQVFRFFGLGSMSVLLVLLAFGNLGPLMTGLWVSYLPAEHPYVYHGTLGIFGFGLVVPFVLVFLLLTNPYTRLGQKRWWKIGQICLATLSLICIALMYLFAP